MSIPVEEVPKKNTQEPITSHTGHVTEQGIQGSVHSRLKCMVNTKMATH